MEHEEIVKRIEDYCRQGLLNGIRVSARWYDNEFSMQNVHFADGYLRFDQDVRPSPNDEWRRSQRDGIVCNQCQPWLYEILMEIERVISVDRNLF